jgi:hypothetical protein
MRSTLYGSPSQAISKPRFKSPCARMVKHDLQTTHHDPRDPKAGKAIPLDDYLGLDARGTRALSSLRRSVYKRNSDVFGDPSGVGALSAKHGRVELDLKPGDEVGRRTQMGFVPQPRTTIFSEEANINGTIERGKRFSLPSAMNYSIESIIQSKNTLLRNFGAPEQEEYEILDTNPSGATLNPYQRQRMFRVKDNVPKSVRNYTIKLKDAAYVRDREKLQYQRELEEHMQPILKRFEVYMDIVPEEYIHRKVKDKIIKNQTNSLQRIINGKVFHKTRFDLTTQKLFEIIEQEKEEADELQRQIQQTEAYKHQSKQQQKAEARVQGAVQNEIAAFFKPGLAADDHQPDFNIGTKVDKNQSNKNVLGAFNSPKPNALGALEIKVSPSPKPSQVAHKQRALRKRSPVSAAAQNQDDEETRSFWAVRM